MIRLGLVIFCVFCVAMVLSEVLGIALLWHRGQLSVDTLKEIRLVLSGDTQVGGLDDEGEDSVQSSMEQVIEARSKKILNLVTREDQQLQLRNMIERDRDKLLQARSELENRRQEFEDRLTALKGQLNGEAVEQARAILLAMPPAETVRHLMEEDLEQCVILLKGMPEKKSAAILEEFFLGAGAQNDERVERAHDIIRAIGKGYPERKTIEDAVFEQTPDRGTPQVRR